MSRLDFAPKLDSISVTDIKKGLGEFTPKPGKAVSFVALKEALKRAGYTLAAADITVTGKLAGDGKGWLIEADGSGQRFALAGPDVGKLVEGLEAGSDVEITGDWQTVGKGAAGREVIRPASIKRAGATTTGKNLAREGEASSLLDTIIVSLVTDGTIGEDGGLFFSPIRTTSPGLTVYRGGAVMPRYSYTRQHLGGLKVDRQGLRVGVSYTPTSTLQLEVEVPYLHTSFEEDGRAGSGQGLGNVTLWGKYRFYRTLETWGDKQAALRFGAELPTGKKSAPGPQDLSEPDFVRQQLSPINGGFAFHADLSYSQARHRFIYGANVEATLRTDRDGFRTGHEVRVNTDFEYVLLPFKYQTPGRELFAILETSYNYRGRGRVGGGEVPGSGGSEFFVAPGLQFTATPRLVIEGSFQIPVARGLGPLALRTDKSLLVGVRFLY